MIGLQGSNRVNSCARWIALLPTQNKKMDALTVHTLGGNTRTDLFLGVDDIVCNCADQSTKILDQRGAALNKGALT